MTRFRVTAAITVSFLFVIGCSGGREPYKKDLVKVTGTVKLDDKPLAGATVTFIPTGTTKGLGASGKSDGSGAYSLTTPMGHEGVLPGEYKVIVSKLVDKSGKDVDTSDIRQAANAQQAVPMIYTGLSTTPVKLTVPAGGGTLDIPLKSK
jgi:hypothetical protein